MKKIILFPIMLFIVSSVSSVYGQIQDVGFDYTVTAVPDNLPVNNYDTIYNVSCIIDLPDTQNLAKIHVKMGGSDGSGNKVDHSFIYDQTGGLPAGLAYNRNGQTVTLDLGKFGAGIYYYEVELEDSSAKLSKKVKWNSRSKKQTTE